MEDIFRRQVLGEWRDACESPYVRAWIAYHEAADRVDGHLHPYDRSLAKEAVAAGNVAMKQVLDDANLSRPSPDDRDWQRAKRTALEILRK